MAALMLARLAAAPVDPYGADGAAWLEHHERVNVAFAFSELPVDQAINNSDGAFPPGLHLVSLLFGELEFDEAAVAATSLVSWLLLALAIGGCVRELSGDRDLFALGFVFGLLLPVNHASAIRYYFDLPMTTWMWLAAWALLRWRAERPALAAALCAALMMVSCVIKWPTLAYGPPLVIGAALAGPRGEHTWRRPWLAGALAAVAWAALLVVVLRVLGHDNSMAGMIGETFSGKLGVERDTPQGVVAILSMLVDAMHAQVTRLQGVGRWFYFYKLVLSVWSPALCLAGLPLAIAWLLARCPGGGFVWLVALGHGVFLIFFLPVFDDRFLLPFAPLGPIVAALGWAHLRADLRRPMAAVMIAAGLWVAVDFHAGRREGPEVVLIGDDRDFEPVERFGWGLACSVEHRGWGRFDHPGRPRRTGLRRAVGAALLETRTAGVGFAIEQPQIHPFGDETYYKFVSGRHTVLTGAAAFDTVPICPLPRHTPDPRPRPFDLVVAPAGEAAGLPPCLEPSDWRLERLIDDPDGGDGVGLWRRVTP